MDIARTVVAACTAAALVALSGLAAGIHERGLGVSSALKLTRGINALWTHRGAMHPMPAR
ncbi:MAG: hypothetical protein NTV97_06440 [Alphaproteobacteria bacterium]|nr:hypothetical protein [Alphaproteobacteria bacterium]